MLDLSCPNQLTADQNAPEFRLSSILVGQQKKMWLRSKMTDSIWLSPTPRHFVQSLLLLGFIPGFQLRELLSTVFFQGQLTNSHKKRKLPGQICWSYPKISVLELQDSSGLTHFMLLMCNDRIVDVLSVRKARSSPFPQQDRDTFEVRAVLNLFFLITLCALTRVATEFAHNSRSKWGFLHERIAMKQQSR